MYDSATQAIAAAFPLAQEGPLASALLSLTGGLAAGVVAAAVSTPADTLLTLSQSPPPNADEEGGARAEPPTMMEVRSATLSLSLSLARSLAFSPLSLPLFLAFSLSFRRPARSTRRPSLAARYRAQLAKDMVAKDPLALFNGLLPRCLFFGALIAGQFLLYDYFKRLFNVGSDDIVFYLDVFASTDLSFWPRSADTTLLP